MTLNFETNTTKACTKPYQLNLNDCLACSGCITNQDINNLSKKIDPTILTNEFTFLMSPHSKINMYNEITKIMESKYDTNVLFNYDKSNECNINKTNKENHAQKCKKHNYKMTYNDFEDLLLRFVSKKYKHSIIDISHAYEIMYKYAMENITNETKITSSCPGVVAYIERKGHNLIDKLLKCKSPQQILSEAYKEKEIISVVTCYDKKLEDSTVKHTISTIEYFTFLIDNGFLDFLCNAESQNIIANAYDESKLEIVESHYKYKKNNDFVNSCSKYILNNHVELQYNKINENDVFNVNNIEVKLCKDNNKKANNLHKTIAVNEQYIEYFCKNGGYEKIEVSKVNKNFMIFTCIKNDKKYRFARIYGLPNFLNFINKSKKVVNEYNFVEAFICDYSCINGPVQIKNNLDVDLKCIEHNLHETSCTSNINYNINVYRKFTAQKQNKKEYKIEW